MIENIVEIKGIHKKFGGVKALNGVSFNIPKGKIVALVGDNGCGKSTLAKILSGVIKPDNGEIKINNYWYKSLSIKECLNNGIVTVYQDLALDDFRDVPGNIFLGREPLKFKLFIDNKRMYRDSKEILNKLNINIQNLKVPVANLSGGQRQAVAIAKAFRENAKLIIMDEPTAAMGVKETEKVVELIKKLNEKGFSILIVSHNLNQVYELAHNIEIMSQGKIIKSLYSDDISFEDLQGILIGKEN